MRKLQYPSILMEDFKNCINPIWAKNSVEAQKYVIH